MIADLPNDTILTESDVLIGVQGRSAAPNSLFPPQACQLSLFKDSDPHKPKDPNRYNDDQ